MHNACTCGLPLASHAARQGALNTIHVYDLDGGMLALLCKSWPPPPPLPPLSSPPCIFNRYFYTTAAAENDDVDLSSKAEAAVADDLHSLRASLAGTL